MNRRKLFVLLTIAATVAAYFIIVPLAQHYAAQQLGWDESGQRTLAKFAFFPCLLVCIMVLRKVTAQRPDQSPDSR